MLETATSFPKPRLSAFGARMRQRAPARRLLLLIPSLAGFGGTERVVMSLSALLSAPERDVFIATFDPVAQSRVDSASIFSLGPIPRLPLALRPVSYALAANRLRRLKKKLGVDLTISNLWGSDLISVLSGGRDHKIALCHTNVVGSATNRLMVSFRPFVAAIYRRFDRVIAVSEPLARQLKALYRLPSRQITHIENFVEKQEPVSRLPSDGVRRFVWCGRLVTEKNVEGLLHVWHDFVRQGSKGTQLVVLGDGALWDALIALAGDLGLRIGRVVEDSEAQVVFAGRVSDPAAYMLGASALVLTSRAEGLPMVLLEALSLGVPVLASDCESGGIRRAMIGDGICDPRRRRAEYTQAGALLPVPDGADPQSLRVWREALREACQDDGPSGRWREGALARACLFTKDAARSRWLEAICF
jgi:glycosyltransferase involved in cell wall biosynthesis